MVLVAAGQLALLIPASFWLADRLSHAAAETARSGLAASNTRQVILVTALIEDIIDRDFEEDSEEYDQLQKLILRMGRPYGATLVLVRSETREIVASPDELEAVPDLVPIASRRMPTLGLTLLALPNERDVQFLSTQFNEYVRLVIIALLLVVVSGSTLLTALIVHRYENRLARINVDLAEQVESRSRDLLKSRSAVIFGLAMLAESRDGETGLHLDRIRNYVRLLGDDLVKTHPEVDAEFVDTIEETSALHDIGKVGVPDHVLLSPDQLTDEERVIIRKHPLIGLDTMMAVKRRWGDDPFLVTACEICFAHHERWDGTGYPFGLKGDTIPLAARIVALADVYDALTSRRVYKEAMPHEHAKQYIVRESGGHFDPAIVDAFISCEEAFREVLESTES